MRSLEVVIVEAVMQAIMPAVFEALSSFVSLPPLSRQAMSLLGKLGGRSHAHINGAQDLAYKPNPEHGLRATLTFPAGPAKPDAAPPTATTFLLPLDRFLQFVTTDRAAPSASAPLELRMQSFKFIKACLATMMNVDSQFTEAERAEGELLVDVLMKRLVPSPPLQSSSSAARSKQQQQAEEHCFEVQCPSCLTLLPVTPGLSEPFGCDRAVVWCAVPHGGGNQRGRR